MEGLDWGLLYNEYGNNVYDPNELEAEIKALLQDDDVTKQKGVYEYLLSGKTKEKVLSIRAFTENEKRTLCERQQGICPCVRPRENTSIGPLKKCTQITKSPGAKADIQHWKMVKCSAGSIILPRATNELFALKNPLFCAWSPGCPLSGISAVSFLHKKLEKHRIS